MRKLLIVCFLFLASCNSLPENETYEPATLKLVNSSTYDVYYLYVAPCDAITWGPDQLGTEIVPAGRGFTLSNIPPGCYHLMADTNTLIYWESDGPVNLRAGHTFTWIVR